MLAIIWADALLAVIPVQELKNSLNMLSPKEKQEMLQDARNTQRRGAFRQARTCGPLPSFDAYLEFFNSVHKVFTRVSSAPSLTRGHFKL
ncbi:MAG: hypothetical protein HZC18_07445 [Candidatus Omnitrophica bacterium]|nr:hypothetical protein [Candidatus Omnitrophota bacterium]